MGWVEVGKLQKLNGSSNSSVKTERRRRKNYSTQPNMLESCMKQFCAVCNCLYFPSIRVTPKASQRKGEERPKRLGSDRLTPQTRRYITLHTIQPRQTGTERRHKSLAVYHPISSVAIVFLSPLVVQILLAQKISNFSLQSNPPANSHHVPITRHFLVTLP